MRIKSNGWGGSQSYQGGHPVRGARMTEAKGARRRRVVLESRVLATGALEEAGAPARPRLQRPHGGEPLLDGSPAVLRDLPERSLYPGRVHRSTAGRRRPFQKT